MSIASEAPHILPQSIYAQARSLYWKGMCALLWYRAGHKIWSGPFAGTKYRVGAVCSASVPKLLGTYERELQSEIEKLASARWSAVIDVGAAEGYYAVGFARRLRNVPVLAYEMDPYGRALLTANAEENKVVDSIELRGECTASAFAEVLHERPGPVLVIMDVEGAEAELIEAASSRDLAKATFVIEVHDFKSDGPLISSRLRNALAPSHEIQVVSAAPRLSRDFPSAFWFVPQHNRMHAMDEYRPVAMEWMICRPRA